MVNITGCYATGNASTTVSTYGYGYAGGFFGLCLKATLSKCYATGDASAVAVAGGAYAGGFIGDMQSAVPASPSSATNCYSTGSATANCVTRERAGGFAGVNNSSSTLSNCYSAGIPTTVQNSTAALGGLVGLKLGTVSNSYYDTTVSGQTDSTKGTPTATADMKISAFVTALTDSAWKLVSNLNAGYPVLDGVGVGALPTSTITYKDSADTSTTYGTQTVAQSVVFALPSTVSPTKSGSALTGWFTTTACAALDQWNFSTGTVTADRTLYAGWALADTTAPETTITAQPANLSASASATFNFSGDDASGSGVASYEVSLDGGAYTAATSPVMLTGLADGSHTFAVRAIDAAGNVDATPASYTWMIDATAPAVPAIGAITVTGVSGTAEAGSTVEVLSGSTSLGTVTADGSGNWRVAVTLADGSYSLTATSTDAAGNATGTLVPTTHTIDTVAPETAITAHPASLSANATANFTFTGSDGTGSGVASYEASFDGASYAAATSPVALTGLADGSHTFAVRAIDAAGNVDTTPASYTWMIDTTAPSAPTIATISPTGVSGTAEAGSTVEVFSGSTSLGTVTADGSGNWRLAVTLADGSYSLTATSTDAAGHSTGTTAPTTRTIDTTAPTLTVVTLVSSNATPTLAKAGDVVTLIFTPNETLQAPTVTLAGAPVTATYADVSGQWTATHTVALGGTEGAVAFSIVFLDVAGNAGTAVTATTDASTVAIDLTAPETTITAHPASLSASTDATFIFSSADASASFEASLDGAAYAAATSPVALTGLADGSHTFVVRAIDAAGNVDATPASYTWTVDTVVTPPVVTPPSTPIVPDARPTITGTAEAGSRVSVYEGTTLLGTTTADAAGAWRFTPATALDDGEHTFTVTATDAAGNVSLISSMQLTIEATSRFAALSARGPVGTGEQTLTLGFVFGGSGSKPTLVRGVGPGISATVPGAVADPSLSLFNYTAGGWSAVDANDDWAGAAALRTAFAATGAGALADGSKDAALLATLPDRIYTAQVTAAGSGVVLAETYDAALSDRTRWLTALSVRNQVGTGAQTLITGFVIDGTKPKAVIVRAVGPGLSSAVTNYLANPEIRLWRLAGGAWTLVDSNDDWSGSATDAATFAAVGMGPLTAGSKDSALLLTLEPGIYTVQVTGVGGTTGIALTEIYEAP